jgi:hypothetical protein
VYSVGVAGGNLTTVVAGLSAPNDVVYDADYDKLYIVCATEVGRGWADLQEDGMGTRALQSVPVHKSIREGARALQSVPIHKLIREGEITL